MAGPLTAGLSHWSGRWLRHGGQSGPVPVRFGAGPSSGERLGQIILGADDGGAHCCLSTCIARLGAHSRLDKSFGSGGMAAPGAGGRA
jgi:hypothetical protein